MAVIVVIIVPHSLLTKGKVWPKVRGVPGLIQAAKAPFYLFDEIDAALDAQYRTAVARRDGVRECW